MKTSKCKKHGIFTEEQAYKSKDVRYKGGYKLVCIQCCQDRKIVKHERNTSNYCVLHGGLDEKNSYRSEENGKTRFRCKICYHENSKKYYTSNRQKLIDNALKWKKENRDRVNELARKDYKNNPEKYKKWRENYLYPNSEKRKEWRKKYYESKRYEIGTREVCRNHGVEVKTYNEMMEAQQGKCALCGKAETRKMRGRVMRLCIDHNHETGKIRALLCHDCNSGLGKFYDSPDLLTMAAIYLMENE